ncbi:MAG: TaqI-like C-terminal specificity domain-containing protein [Bacteroidales bacterium]
MKLYEAKNIITEVFENPFDKDKFSYFIRNLLKNLHPAEFRRSGYNIPKAFEDFIASYERLGKYEDEEGNLIDVLIIKLKRNYSIDYARSTQRNFVRWYLNDKGKDAALVAFTTEKSSEWRFSFIKMQYSLEKKKDELTPAKRSSFLVGESGNSHTAQRQLIDLLKNDHTPYLSDIEDAFSIEAVSDEFYEKYKALLFNLVDEIENVVKRDKTVKEEFESKEISILNFSKKLLGQIAFLYFLQKKGWLGLEEKEKYGEGDKNFLRSLFNKTKKGENFFNDYLEYLFYDALSKKRVTDYYERFKTRIPFLNGGLFDPIEFYDWQKTDIVIPNKIFSDRKSDEEGTGVLDVFDLYNFTVKEDEPLETEVAIDPEMLGKVFERMLEVTERKSKGAFYTPREIVHYMAQQSLLYFLETELNQTVSYNKLGDKQSEIFGNEGKKGQLGLLTENKACVVPKVDLEKFIHFGEHIIDKDIAIEEGKLKQTANKQTIPESIRQNADDIDQALKNIKICDPAVGSGAFPVGIMNEIVKLRKLLTPFLKEERADERSAYRFKSNAIQNSIYGVDIDAGAVEIAKLRLWLSMVVDEERINTIEPLPNLEYKIVQGNSLINIPDGTAINDALATEIENLTTAYFHITDKEKKQEQKQIIDAKIKEQLQFVSEMVGYEIDFDFKLYFHEVWNEKGGFDIVIGNPPYDVYEGKKKNEIPTIKRINIYDKAKTGKLNAYKLFIAKSITLAKQNGIFCQIFQNSFLGDNSAKVLRKHFLTNQIILRIDSFPERDNINKRVFKSAKMSVCILFAQNMKVNNFNFDLVLWKERWMQNNSFVNFSNVELLEYDKSTNVIPSISSSEKTVLNKLSKYPRFGNYITCYQGEINLSTNKEIITTIDSTDTKPLLKGAGIQKWYLPLKMSQGQIEYLQYKKYITRNNGPKSKHYKDLRIVMQGITGVDENYRIKATLLDENTFCGHSVNYISLENINQENAKYYLALLNSTISNWFFKKFSTNSNVNSYEIHNLPVIIKSDFKSVVVIVDYLLTLKRIQEEKFSFFFEQLIDGMVYELYFEKEIKQAGCDILKYLDDLPEIKDEMPDEEKLKIITKVFNKLYDKESPVRKNLFFMDSVEEVAIIKKSLEK